MRSREQIYGQEAAELLRNITVYHCMRRDQLLRLYPGKEGVIENLLRYLVKQQRIFYNTDRDCYGDVPDCREDRELTAALRRSPSGLAYLSLSQPFWPSLRLYAATHRSGF